MYISQMMIILRDRFFLTMLMTRLAVPKLTGFTVAVLTNLVSWDLFFIARLKKFPGLVYLILLLLFTTWDQVRLMLSRLPQKCLSHLLHGRHDWISVCFPRSRTGRVVILSHNRPSSLVHTGILPTLSSVFLLIYQGFGYYSQSICWHVVLEYK